MSTINDSDLLLVERNGNLHQITYDQMSTLNDDDILLVERGGVQYKLAAADLDLKSGTLGSPVEVLTPLDGAGVGGPRSFTPQTDDITDIKQVLDYGWASNGSWVSGGPSNILSLVYGNGTYVALHRYEGPRYSTDEGLTWTSSTWVGGNSWYQITWNGSVFCAVGSAPSKIATSTDGITWTPVSSPPNVSFYCVNSDTSSGRMVAGGNDLTQNGKGLWYSTNNGASWSQCSIGGNNWLAQSDKDFYFIAYGGGKWVALVGNQYSAAPAYSSNGTSFTLNNGRIAPTTAAWDDLFWDSNSNRFVAFLMSGGNLYTFTSYNGSSWTENKDEGMSPSDNKYENGFAVGNGTYIMIPQGQNGFYMTTPSQGFNQWSWFGNRGFWTSGNHNHQKIFFANGLYWLFEDNHVYKLPAQTDGQIDGFLTDGDRFVSKKMDVLTLASTNVYDSSDGSLVTDLTLADVFSTPDDRVEPSGGTGVATHSSRSIVDLDGTTLSIGRNRWNSTYTAGIFALGDRVNRDNQLTEYGPSPTEVEFTSQNAGTTPVSATEATLSFRRWTLETRSSAGDPWTVVTTADDYDPVASQDGATPWSSNKPTLTPDTMYRVKVEYISANADPIQSVYHTFTTGPNS